MSRVVIPRFFQRPIVLIGIVAAVSLGAYYATRGDAAGPAAGGDAGGRPGGGGGFPGGGGGFGGFGGGGGPRQPMTVELAEVKRGEVSASIQVVGNLIGLQTVEATPKVAGRLQTVNVHMGDRVARGQVVAKVEDQEIHEQVKQAQAAYEVSRATIRQREADLKLAKTNLDRSQNLYERQLIPRQTLDDTQSRYDAAVAQLDLANAQNAQSKARLDEVSINLANTSIISPLAGVVGRRMLDPGAWVTPQSAFISVVDISSVRLVASIVEKDIRLISEGMPVRVEVDAFPGEVFQGKVAHVAPVLDPTTRTAQIEVVIANPDFRLKPGMYAKVSLTTERHSNVLVIPTTALVDQGDQRGVFLTQAGQRGQTAHFQPVQVGLMDLSFVEITSGLEEGTPVVITGAGGLREGDPVLLPGEAQGGGAQGGSGQGRGQGQGGPRGRGRGSQGGAQSEPTGRGQGGQPPQPGSTEAQSTTPSPAPTGPGGGEAQGEAQARRPGGAQPAPRRNPAQEGSE